MIESLNLYERNYANDPRVRALEDKWWDCIDDSKMRARLLDDGEGGPRQWVAIRWAVCTLCQGKGTVVNPSIDCGGLTSDDFDADPGFCEYYISGSYDIPCTLCEGRRVQPIRIA